MKKQPKPKPLTQEEFDQGKPCPMSHKPNKTTIRAIKESMNAKGTIRARTVEELFEKLKR